MYGWLFDVRDFGAKGDAITDDSPAFQAAMDAMGPVTSGKARHGTLFVPPGVYRFKDDLKIERALKLVGTGPGSAWSKSRLLFDPYKGIRVYSAENSPRGGDANYAVIEDIDINCEGPSAPSHPVWQPKHKYNVGDKILPAVDRTTRPGSSWEYFYECVKSGTSGQEEPDWSVTQFIDQATLWQPETAYYYSSVVRPPERFDVYFTPNPPDHDGTYPSQPDLLKGAIKSGTTLPGEFLKAEPGDVVQEVNLSGEQITWHCYSTGSTPPLWRSGRRYAVGKVVRASTRGDALFRLSGPEDNTFRTSAPPEPGIFSTAAPGTTFTELGPDGSLTWECYLDPTIWQQYTDVNRGVRVRPTHRYDVAFSLRKISDLSGTKNFDSAKTGKAEPAAFATARPGQAVKEVGTNPTGNTTPGAETRILEWLCHSAGNYLVGDGRTLARDDPDPGPIWACRVAAAIYAQARVTINRVYVQSALNAGLHVQADGFYLPSSNANPLINHATRHRWRISADQTEAAGEWRRLVPSHVGNRRPPPKLCF